MFYSPRGWRHRSGSLTGTLSFGKCDQEKSIGLTSYNKPHEWAKAEIIYTENEEKRRTGPPHH